MTWLHEHFHKLATPEAAQNAIARYRMGIKSGGSIRGVRIDPGPGACDACRALAANVYQPDEVPALPLEGCTNPTGCQCAYRPVMVYEERP